METKTICGQMIARLERTRKEWDAAEMSDQDFNAVMSLYSTLSSWVTVLEGGMVLAISKHRLRIFTMLQNQLIGPDEDEEALPVESQPLEEEKYLDLWRPFITPIPDEKMDEWFSDPQKAKAILEKKVKELQENLKILREVYDDRTPL